MSFSTLFQWYDTTGLIQASAIAVITLLVIRISNPSPSLRQTLAVFGLLAMLVLPLAGRVPWPEVSFAVSPAQTTDSNQVVATAQTPTTIQQVGSANPTIATSENPTFLNSLISQAQSFQLAGQSSSVETSSQRYSWLAALFGIVAILRCIQLLIGAIRIEFICKWANALQVETLRTDVEELREVLGIRQTIRLHSTDLLQSPAVVGWFHPVILVPTDFCDWNRSQQHAALAHELAHVRGRDPSVSLIAHLIAIPIYLNPLCHLLLYQLRLGQETRADALASRCVGGTSPYVRSLAELAVRKPTGRLSANAIATIHSFSHQPPTLLWRIDMLRRKSHGSRIPIGSKLAASIIPLLIVCCLLTEIRPKVLSAQAPEKPSPVAQVPTDTSAKPKTDEDIVPLTKYLADDDAVLVMLINYPKLMDSKIIKSLRKKMPKEIIESMLSPERKQPHITGDDTQYLMTISGVTTGSANLIRLRDESKKFKEAFYGSILDARTLFVGDQDFKERALRAAASETESLFAARLKANANSGFVVSVDVQSMLSTLPKEALLEPPMIMFAPLVSQVTWLDANAIFGDDLIGVLKLDTQDVEGTKATLENLLTFARQFLEATGKNLPEGESLMTENNEPTKRTVKEALKVLDSVSIKTSEGKVELRAEIDGDIFSDLVAPAITAANIAAERMQSSNNLKICALALHNYHYRNGHFPAAFIVDPSGHVRSWRVEILPFIGQAALYEQYRKDEAWDSEANLLVLDAMPEAYRLPGNTEGTNLTPYLAIASPEMGLAPVGEAMLGPSLELDFADGTATTVLLVESSKHVPWTQPIDVEDPARILDTPVWENGTQVAFADGNVQFVATSIDKALLMSLMTRNGNDFIEQYQP